MTVGTPARRGHTLTELLVAMTILAVVGAAVTRLVVVQSRAFEWQAAAKSARAVSRAALNYMESELRMVEAAGGVTAANATSITLRVPYALGVVCSPTTISILPVDSMMYAQASFAGYAWRDSTTGAYAYVTPATVSGGVASTCTTASVTTLSGGQVLAVTPSLPAGAVVGNNVLLYQLTNYSFGPSGLIPGRWGLFRTVLPGGIPEELAVPLDSSTARFAFFNLNVDTAQTTVPALTDVRGIELRLTGQSQRVPRGSSAYVSSPLTAAIYFANRMN